MYINRCVLSIFSTMSEIYINGRSSSHNSSLEIWDFGTSIVTNSGLLVTAESYNSTIAIITPANTLDSDSSFCGLFTDCVVLFCIGFVITIAIFLAMRIKRPKIRRKHGAKLSFLMEPLSPMLFNIRHKN